MTLRPRWSWAWLPVVVIAIAAIPNAIFLGVALRVHPTKVEAKAWEASAGIDRAKDAAAAFAAAGRSFAVQAAPGGLVARIAGPAPEAALRLRLYRPDDPRLDRLLAWPAGARDLAAAELRPGLWRAILLDGDDRLAEAAVDVPAPAP